MSNRPSPVWFWSGVFLLVVGIGLLVARILTGETALLGMLGSIALAAFGGLLVLQSFRGRRPRR